MENNNWFQFDFNQNLMPSLLISAIKPIECSDYKKQVPSGYPYIFYHATSDINSVCSKGLLPSAKINERFIRLKSILDIEPFQLKQYKYIKIERKNLSGF